MSGFSDEIRGLISILKEIEANDESGKFTHKEVRAYARCLLAIFLEFSFSDSVEPEIKVLLKALSSAGLPHYDRSFLASRMLKLVEDMEHERSLKSSQTGEDVF